MKFCIEIIYVGLDTLSNLGFKIYNKIVSMK